MIVFDLKCGAGHVFEAWFGSGAAFDEQRRAGQLACPICGVGEVDKAAMAPNISAKGNRAAGPAPQVVKDAMKALAKAQAAALESSQWVGGAFATKARAMHLGEEKHAPIHGQATLADAKALIDEGVAVAPLPMPVVPPEASN